MKKKKRKIFIGIITAVVLLAVASIIYLNMGQYKATVEAFSSLSSDDNLVVERVDGEYIAFYP